MNCQSANHGLSEGGGSEVAVDPDKLSRKLDRAAERQHKQLVGELMDQVPRGHQTDEMTKLRRRVQEALLRDWSHPAA